jgi:hypothetical protein
MIQLCLNLKALKSAIAAGKQIAKSSLLRKCGLLAHTSPAFLKNCWIKKLFFRLRLIAYSQSSKKAAASLQEVAAFLQNIPKIKWFVAKLFYTFYSQNLIIFPVSVVYINCFHSIRCVFNTSKIIDY